MSMMEDETTAEYRLGFERGRKAERERIYREKKLREDLDSLYRDKHDLKQLGDREVRVKRAKDGSLEIADRVGLKRQVRELKLEQEKSKTRNPGHER